ncbi:hypothetical protein LTR17_020162 [Elasticomyces elasticus]|nr:hypothetical protein LTR17_020162 [Elasticomyces elasticus]
MRMFMIDVAVKNCGSVFDMVLSDIDIGGHYVYGSLEEVSDKYKYSHCDFDFYRRLMDLFAEGQDLSLLADTKQATGKGWNLDKWKFVPIAHRVYVERPDIKWYIFLEADAYMEWSNLLELLSKFDPDKPWYLGATHFYEDVAFVHGGTGYVISNGAIRVLDTIWKPHKSARWEHRTAAGCCGDVELAAVLQESGVNITGIPGLYGESLSWFEWDKELMTWSHCGNSKRIGPLTTRCTMFTVTFSRKLMKSHLVSTRSDWDNMSRDGAYTGPSGLHGGEDRRYPPRSTWGELSNEENVEQLGQLDDEQKKDIEGDCTHVKEMRWYELSDEEKEVTRRELTEPDL